MTPRLRWFARPMASCLHAVAAIQSNRAISDTDWHRVLAEPSRVWLTRLLPIGIPIDAFLAEAVAATIEASSPAEIVPRAMAAVSDPRLPMQFDAQRTASIIDGLHSVFDSMMRAFPNLEREVLLRIGPLRDHWEARGPGLLRVLQQTTHGRPLDDFTSVLIVHPLHDGDVQPLDHHRGLLVEGLLANPEPRLPEIVRLAWGFSRLSGSLADKANHGLNPQRRALVASFGLLPAALEAAEQVEISQAGPDMVALALRAWHLSPVIDPVELWNWWQSHRESGQTWEAALEQLDAQIPSLDAGA